MRDTLQRLGHTGVNCLVSPGALGFHRKGTELRLGSVHWGRAPPRFQGRLAPEGGQDVSLVSRVGRDTECVKFPLSTLTEALCLRQEMRLRGWLQAAR